MLNSEDRKVVQEALDDWHRSDYVDALLAIIDRLTTTTPSAPRQEEDNIEANRVISKAAIEIITECRDALGLQRDAQLTEFCKKVAAFNGQAEWEEYDDHVAARSVAFAGDDDLRADHHHTEMLALRAALLRRFAR